MAGQPLFPTGLERREMRWETDRAFLFSPLACGNREIWWPKKLCEMRGDELYAPAWMIQRNLR